jgi:hypothetical protein
MRRVDDERHAAGWRPAIARGNLRAGQHHAPKPARALFLLLRSPGLHNNVAFRHTYRHARFDSVCSALPHVEEAEIRSEMWNGLTGED